MNEWMNGVVWTHGWRSFVRRRRRCLLVVYEWRGLDSGWRSFVLRRRRRLLVVLRWVNEWRGLDSGWRSFVRRRRRCLLVVLRCLRQAGTTTLHPLLVARRRRRLLRAPWSITKIVKAARRSTDAIAFARWPPSAKILTVGQVRRVCWSLTADWCCADRTFYSDTSRVLARTIPTVTGL